MGVLINSSNRFLTAFLRPRRRGGWQRARGTAKPGCSGPQHPSHGPWATMTTRSTSISLWEFDRTSKRNSQWIYCHEGKLESLDPAKVVLSAHMCFTSTFHPFVHARLSERSFRTLGSSTIFHTHVKLHIASRLKWKKKMIVDESSTEENWIILGKAVLGFRAFIDWSIVVAAVPSALGCPQHVTTFL